MSAVSDSSQEASNAGISASPQIFMKNDMQDLQAPNLFTSNPLLKSGQHAVTSGEQSQKRRSSSRSIKRKKFDDELVESSLAKKISLPPRVKPPSATFPVLSSAGPSVSSAVTSTVCASTSEIKTDVAPPVISIEKRKAQRTQKRIKKPKGCSQAHMSHTKDANHFKPADDLALVLNVQQTNNIETVYRAVKFSSKYTFKELSNRWHSLLYDPAVSKNALYAVKQLRADVIAQIEAKVLFSAEEEKIIASVPSTKGSLEVFEKLLDENTAVFLPARTAKVLHAHWSLMKQYNLLHDQSIYQNAHLDDLLTLSDAEELLDDNSLTDPKDPLVDEEIQHASRKAMYEMKQLENQLPKYHALVEAITGVSLPDFDSSTIAVLRGRIVRYLIQSKEVTLGRSSKECTVDIDLSLEGPAWKVSRKQGSIKVDNNGDFFIINEGKKPIFVDGKPILTGNKAKISTNSVIEITVLRFIFIVNQEAIAAIKAKNNG